MTKKQVKIILSTLQLLLLLMLFLPVGKAADPGGDQPNPLSVFEIARQYAGVGYSSDAAAYLFLACCIPVLTVFFVFLLHDRKNFGTAACLSAFYTMVAACFFTAVGEKIANSVSFTGLQYGIILIALASMGFAIFGYFIAMPPKE